VICLDFDLCYQTRTSYGAQDGGGWVGSGDGGGTGGVGGVMHDRVTDSEFNVKPLFPNFLFSELAPRHCRPRRKR
jgi:hypothetical protein